MAGPGRGSTYEGEGVVVRKRGSGAGKWRAAGAQVAARRCGGQAVRRFAAGALAAAGLTASSANAGPVFLEVGPETSLAQGMWGRVFPADHGWELFFANTSGLWYLPLTPELTSVPSQARNLTGSEYSLVDHAIARCPDDTFLHVASANINALNDTAYAFRYTADLKLVAGGLLDQNASVQHNDPSVVCSDLIDGGAFGVGSVTLIRIDGQARPAGAQILPSASTATGSSMLAETRPDTLLFVTTSRQLLQARRYDDTLSLIGSFSAQFAPEGERVYWPSGLIRVGDMYLIAHMGQTTSETWDADTGNVWLSAYDTAFNLVDQVQVSHNVAPRGGMRPWLERVGDRLLVTYDREFSVWGFEVTIDLEAVEVDEPTPTPTPEPSPTPLPTPDPTATPEPSATPEPTTTPGPWPVGTPDQSPRPGESPTPEETPAVTPDPTATPSAIPTLPPDGTGTPAETATPGDELGGGSCACDLGRSEAGAEVMQGGARSKRPLGAALWVLASGWRVLRRRNG